jgi:hypothetical protein
MAAAVDDPALSTRLRMRTMNARWRPGSVSQRPAVVGGRPLSTQAVLHTLENGINEAFELFNDAPQQASSMLDAPSMAPPTPAAAPPRTNAGLVALQAHPLSARALNSCISDDDSSLGNPHAKASHPLSARALESCLGSSSRLRSTSSPPSSVAQRPSRSSADAERSVPDLSPPPTSSCAVYGSGSYESCDNLLSAFCSSSGLLRGPDLAPPGPPARRLDFCSGPPSCGSLAGGVPPPSGSQLFFDAAAATKAAEVEPLEFVASLASIHGSSEPTSVSSDSSDSLGMPLPMICGNFDIPGASSPEHFGSASPYAWAELDTERLLSQTAAMLFEALPNEGVLPQARGERRRVSDGAPSNIPRPPRRGDRVSDSAVVYVRESRRDATGRGSPAETRTCALRSSGALQNFSGRRASASHLPLAPAVDLSELMLRRERRASTGGDWFGVRGGSGGRAAAFAAELAQRDFLREAQEQLGILREVSEDDGSCPCSTSSSCISSEESVVIVDEGGEAEAARTGGPEEILLDAAARMAMMQVSPLEASASPRKPLLTVSSDVASRESATNAECAYRAAAAAAARLSADMQGERRSVALDRVDTERGGCGAATSVGSRLEGARRSVAAQGSPGPLDYVYARGPGQTHGAVAARLAAEMQGARCSVAAEGLPAPLNRADTPPSGPPRRRSCTDPIPVGFCAAPGGESMAASVGSQLSNDSRESVPTASASEPRARRQRASEGMFVVKSASPPAATKRARQVANAAAEPLLATEEGDATRRPALGGGTDAKDDPDTSMDVQAPSAALNHASTAGAAPASHARAAGSFKEAFLGLQAQKNCKPVDDGEPEELSYWVRPFQPPRSMVGGRLITPRSQRHVFRSAARDDSGTESSALGEGTSCSLSTSVRAAGQSASGANCLHAAAQTGDEAGGTGALRWLQPDRPLGAMFVQ